MADEKQKKKDEIEPLREPRQAAKKAAGKNGKGKKESDLSKTAELFKKGELVRATEAAKTGEGAAAPQGEEAKPASAEDKALAQVAGLSKTGSLPAAPQLGSPTKAPGDKKDPASRELAPGDKRPPAKAKQKADSEQLRLKKEEQARSSRRRNRQLIGFALAILIVVGAVSIVRSGVGLVSSMLNSEEERLEYQERFEPMVWFNILPFESVSQVDENSIKQVAIWGLMNDKQDQFERNERGEALIPYSEVDQYGAGLFGPDFRFSGHETFTDPVQGLTYVFDEATGMYATPVTSLQPEYLASVVEIQREPGGARRVVMGYVSTRTGDDQMVATPDYDHPAFYMDYLLRRDGSQYYLYAIQRNTTHEVSTPASSASVAPPPANDDSISEEAAPPPAAPAASASLAEGDAGEDDSISQSASEDEAA